MELKFLVAIRAQKIRESLELHVLSYLFESPRYDGRKQNENYNSSEFNIEIRELNEWCILYEQNEIYIYISICIENNSPKLKFTHSTQVLGNGNNSTQHVANDAPTQQGNTRSRCTIADRDIAQ